MYDEAIRHPTNDGLKVLVRLFRIGVQGWVAQARLRTGHAAETVALLGPLPAQFAAVPEDRNWVEQRQSATDSVSTLLGEALLEIGEIARARNVLEGGLRSCESAVARQSDSWGYHASLAEVCMLLARTLDPAKPDEAARRKQLLDRAAEILAKGETEGQLTNDNKELQAKVAALLAPKS